MSDELTRSVAFDLERADDTGDGFTLTGYAAVFGDPTRIDSWEGTFDEQIERGAFAESIKTRTPKLQFDHGKHALVGSLPLGVIKRMHEDERGLFVEARLHDNWLIQPVRDAIASGAVDGMSFRFRVPEGGDTWDHARDDVPLRTITRADVLEVGPVVWPAYPSTTVGVRSEDIDPLFDLSDEDRKALAIRLLLGRSDAVGASDHPQPDPSEAVGPESDQTEPGLASHARARDLSLLGL